MKKLFIFLTLLSINVPVAYSMYYDAQLRNHIVRLIEQKGDLNAPLKGVCGKPLIEMAFSERFADLLERLLQNGADPNIGGKYGDTALERAVCKRNLQGARLLLKFGANPNQECVLKKAVSWPDEKPSVDLVVLLLEYNADPNIQNYCGWTALFQAICSSARTYKQEEIHDYTKIIKILLAHGANPLIKCTGGWAEGKNAIDLAREKGLDDIADYLTNAREQIVDERARVLSGQVMTEGCPTLPCEVAEMIAKQSMNID